MNSIANDAWVIPPPLLAEIKAAADAEHRPAADVLRDVIDRGLEDRRWQRLQEYGTRQASQLGLTEADIPRLIAESRREHSQEQAGA